MMRFALQELNAEALRIQQPRIERTTLRDLAAANIDLHDTVVIPPARPLEVDHEMRARLAALDLAVQSV